MDRTMSMQAENLIVNLLNSAGIAVNGNNPWDIQINKNKFYERVLKDGSLGLGEAYVDGDWDCLNLDLFFDRLLTAKLEEKIKSNLRMMFKLLVMRIVNLQTKKRAQIVGKKHYDLGNNLFESMLDKRMNYSCAYWAHATDLDEAQEHKLELSCKKLMLKPGMRILDIGCGFGALAKYAAERYQVNVVGVTISKQQYEYAKENCKGLPITILLQDYRDIKEKFDRIISIGMFEHVGHLNYDTYMKVAHRNLVDQGIFLLHTIGSNITKFDIDEWFGKYIFPNGMLPSIAQIAAASEKYFIMEDWHNFGSDYDKTLLAWHTNFNHYWPQLMNHYDERFFRMWNYYLLACAGAFRARTIQLWQIVFSKEGIRNGYTAPR